MGTKALRVLTTDEAADLLVIEPKSAPVARSKAPNGTGTSGSCGLVIFELIGKGGIWIHAGIRCPSCHAIVSGDAGDLN
jgi:hypothetical protein